MVKIEGSESRAVVRSVYSPDRVFSPGTIVRLEMFGSWPEFEVIERADDGTLTIRPLKDKLVAEPVHEREHDADHDDEPHHLADDKLHTHRHTH